MQATEHSYTFDYAGNSYFMGRDAYITRDDGKSVRINSRQGLLAVNVKDHKGSFTLDDLDEDVQRMVEDLRKHGGGEDQYGRDHVDRLYDQERDLWWQSDAEWLADDHEFGRVYSDGRSSGWCVIEGTRELAESGFNTVPLADALADTDDESECEQIREAYRERDRFLALAFALVESIADRRQVWGETIRAEHEELERRREACLVRGED